MPQDVVATGGKCSLLRWVTGNLFFFLFCSFSWSLWFWKEIGYLESFLDDIPAGRWLLIGCCAHYSVNASCKCYMDSHIWLEVLLSSDCYLTLCNVYVNLFSFGHGIDLPISFRDMRCFDLFYCGSVILVSFAVIYLWSHMHIQLAWFNIFVLLTDFSLGFPWHVESITTIANFYSCNFLLVKLKARLFLFVFLGLLLRYCGIIFFSGGQWSFLLFLFVNNFF